MGRRSKIEAERVAERCHYLFFTEKLTIKEVTERLIEEDDFTGSRESVRRYIEKAKAMANQFQEYQEQARIMMEQWKDTPNTEMSEALLMQLTGLMMQRAMTLDMNDIEDPLDVINATGKLVEASTKASKLRMDFNKGFGAAKDAVVKALKENLQAKDPELLERLTRVVFSLKVEA
jgi:hypothetical protein